MGQAREKHVKEAAPYEGIAEYKMWEEHWIRCCKELNQVRSTTEKYLLK